MRGAGLSGQSNKMRALLDPTASLLSAGQSVRLKASPARSELDHGRGKGRANNCAHSLVYTKGLFRNGTISLMRSDTSDSTEKMFFIRTT